ncbi:MAG: 23S rRNA (guanosine(2251)-2'-O)-methyltransferase RlmB, partial [Proteobacteria bacterium]|nr:23S rRNA (guanosine(2251)-2'-O)-methyltransferase RlmB [Pseudomonadota bacterium]
MSKKNSESRIGFHSIESIIHNNPHKLKKVFLPANRDDARLKEL